MTRSRALYLALLAFGAACLGALLAAELYLLTLYGLAKELHQ